MSLRLFLKLFFGVFLDLFLGLATGASLVFAVGFGVFETVVLELICPSLTFFEVQAVGILVDETEHLIAALFDSLEEDDRQQAAQAARLARSNPHSIYLFGDFSVVDAGLLGGSAYLVAQTELPASVFQVASELLPLIV